MIRAVRNIIVVSICLGAFGCKTLELSSGYYANPLQPGAEITVTQELPVPAGYARVYLQLGKILSYGGVNQYEPFCYFLLNEPLPVAQTVRPGVFRVKSVSLNETEVRRTLPVRVAARWLFAGEDGRGPIAFQSYMSLSAPHQREVRALVCSGAFDSPAHARPIRLAEVQQALGESISVRATPAPGYVR